VEWYNETPRGYVLLGDPSSPNEEPIEPDDPDYDILGGEADMMMGCVGDD